MEKAAFRLKIKLIHDIVAFDFTNGYDFVAFDFEATGTVEFKTISLLV